MNLTGVKNIDDIVYRWKKINNLAKKKAIKRWNHGKDFKEVKVISAMVQTIGHECVEKEKA